MSAPSAELKTVFDLLLSGQEEATVVISYPGDVIRACSDGVKAVLGYRPDELIGRSATILHQCADAYCEFADRICQYLAQGKSFNERLTARRHDGQIIHSVCHVVPVFDSSGEVSSYVSTIRKIGSAGAGCLIDLMINSIPVAIAIARTDDGQLLRANSTCRSFFGLAPNEDLARIRCGDFYADRSEWRVVIDLLTRGETVSNRVIPFRRRDGTMLWASVTMQLAAFGNDNAIVGSFFDITAEREAHDSATHSRRQLEAIIDNAPAHIFLKDRNRQYILQNRRHREDRARAGINPDDRSSYRLHTVESASRLAKLDDDVLWTAAAVTDELDLERKDIGRRRMRITKFPVFDEDGAVSAIGGFSLDITEQHELKERLRHAQRFELIGQLTGGIAHDFNNLLEVIVGNSEMLIEDLADDPKKRRMAELVRKAADRAATLTHRMLAFSRQQDLHPEKIDCAALIVSLTRMLKRSVGEDIELITEFASEPSPVWVDRGELEACLINLVVNARDAMPSGGPIRLRAENVTLDEPASGELRPGDYVRLTVADSGAGMPPEVLERAFDPYFTTKDVSKGTGLGLSMVHGFVKQSGGHVAIESTVGEGSTVTIYLPRLKPTPAMAGGSAPLIAEPLWKAATGSISFEPSEEGPVRLPCGSETVLVVEDEPMVRSYVAAELGRLGYAVVEARDGREAMTALREHSDICLLFTDMVMPGGMRGGELARQARAIRPDLKILFTTGYANAFNDDTPPADETIAVLRKPYPRRRLAEYIRRCLDAA